MVLVHFLNFFFYSIQVHLTAEREHVCSERQRVSQTEGEMPDLSTNCCCCCCGAADFQVGCIILFLFLIYRCNI